ncbi:MAG: hypothetical protein WBB29_23050 [Geitlerinemataceae cyanobacterium]
MPFQSSPVLPPPRPTRIQRRSIAPEIPEVRSTPTVPRTEPNPIAKANNSPQPPVLTTGTTRPLLSRVLALVNPPARYETETTQPSPLLSFIEPSDSQQKPSIVPVSSKSQRKTVDLVALSFGTKQD